MTEDFFAGIEQQRAHVLGVEAKTPLFYRDARMFSLIFPARLDAIRRLLPDERFEPARLLPGVGAVHLSAFEYHDCDIGPYNEFAIGAFLNSPDFQKVPSYNIVRQLVRSSFHTYVLRLPVTTDTALRAGVDLYNYPKFLASIDFEDTGGEMACRLAEGGDLICRLAGRKIQAKMSDIVQYFCHMYQDRQPQSAEFKVNARSYGLALGPGHGKLELGASHPAARELDGLLLSKTPLVYFYMPSMQAVLYGPEHLSLAMIGRFLERALHVPLEEFRSSPPKIARPNETSGMQTRRDGGPS